VRDHEHRASFLSEAGKVIKDRIGILGIEIAGRFVGQQKLGFEKQRSGERYSLLFAYA
jgi:hypothetical protein